MARIIPTNYLLYMSDKSFVAIEHKEKRVTFVTFKEVDNVRQ